jgi:hypothetical protein
MARAIELSMISRIPAAFHAEPERLRDPLLDRRARGLHVEG